MHFWLSCTRRNPHQIALSALRHPQMQQAAKLLDKFGRPLKPSFFTSRSDFYETFNFLDGVLQRLERELSPSSSSASSKSLETSCQRTWSEKQDLEMKLGFKMRPDEFQRLTEKLQALARFQDPKITSLSSLLDIFTCEKALQEEARKASYSRKEVDSQGISHALGRRKEARAQVWLRKLEGGSRENVPLIVVNDAPVHEYFKGCVKNCSHVWKPFELTQSLGEWTVWASVEGGGFSGQAQALRHAIANALVKQDSTFFDALEAENLLAIDWRRLERKKPGKPKARRSEQWSKR